MTTHVVTAPLVIVRDETGAQQYHYRDAVLPSYVKTADLKRLVAEGLVARLEAPLEPTPQPPLEPTAPAPTPGHRKGAPVL